MATTNTAFKVDNGLLVIGTANVSANLNVGGNLTVSGNIVVSGRNEGDFLPSTTDTYALGNTTYVWQNIFVTTATVGNVVASELNSSGDANTATLHVRGLAKLDANLSFTNTVSTTGVEIANSLSFDYDLLTIDATNNRVGIKKLANTLNANGVLTIGGTTVVEANNAGLKFFNSSNGSVNASLLFAGNTSAANLTLTTFDYSNSTVEKGGLFIKGANSTATFDLLTISKTSIKYLGGNVAHSGNFGVYNVSGTRVGP